MPPVTTTTASPPSTLLNTYSSNLTHYRTSLSTAEARIKTLTHTLETLSSQLTATRTERDFYLKRVRELDRDARIRGLELDAANRIRGGMEREVARLRVEMEGMRRRQGEGEVCERCGGTGRIPTRKGRRSSGSRKIAVEEGEGEGEEELVSKPQPAVGRIPVPKSLAGKGAKFLDTRMSRSPKVKVKDEEEVVDEEEAPLQPDPEEEAKRTIRRYQESLIGDGRRERTKQLRDNLKAARERVEKRSLVDRLVEEYAEGGGREGSEW